VTSTADLGAPRRFAMPQPGTVVWHLEVTAQCWDTKQHCVCGAEFASRCELWKHQADAYIALAPNDGSRAYDADCDCPRGPSSHPHAVHATDCASKRHASPNDGSRGTT
jgi:hypothetical protein